VAAAESAPAAAAACGDLLTSLSRIVALLARLTLEDAAPAGVGAPVDPAATSSGPVTDIVSAGVQIGRSEPAAGGATGPSERPGEPSASGPEARGTIELVDQGPDDPIVARVDVELPCDRGTTPELETPSAPGGAIVPVGAGEGLPDGSDPVAVDGPVEPVPPTGQIGELIPRTGGGQLVVAGLELSSTARRSGTADAFVESLEVTVGDAVELRYVVANTGAAAVYDVSDISDDLGTPGPDAGADDVTVAVSGLTDEDGDGSFDDLAAGGSATVTATVVVATPGTVVSTSTVTAYDAAGTEPASHSATDTVTIVVVEGPPPTEDPVRLVLGAIAGDDVVANVVEPGAMVTFHVTVHNDIPSPQGDAVLTALTSDLYGDLTVVGHDGIVTTNCRAGVVVAGDSSHACLFTIDLRSQPGIITNTVTATLTAGATASELSDRARVVVRDARSNIDVTTQVEPGIVDEPGGEVRFDVTVRNTSSADTVTIESIEDDLHGDLNGRGDCRTPVVVAVSESHTCSFPARVAGEPGVSQVNAVSVTGVDDDGKRVHDSAVASVFVADVVSSIAVTNTPDVESVAEAGGDVVYTVTVENTSEVDSVTIDSVTTDAPPVDVVPDGPAPVDEGDGAEPVEVGQGEVDGGGIGAHPEDGAESPVEDGSGVSCAAPLPVLLGPGETLACTHTESISGDATGPPHTRTATVTATDDDGRALVQTAQASVSFRDVAPAVAVTAAVDPTTVTAPGGDVELTVTVTNTSGEAVTLDSLSASDLESATPCPAAAGAVLAPGESYACTATSAVVGSAGETRVVTVTVVASDNDGTTTTAAGSVEVAVTTSDPGPIDPGPGFPGPVIVEPVIVGPVEPVEPAIVGPVEPVEPVEEATGPVVLGAAPGGVS
jgi:hypothetical protein